MLFFSNLWGQKELNGLWIDDKNRVFEYPKLQLTGYEIFKGKSSQFVKEWRITCQILDNKISCIDTIYNNYKLIDAWFGDSYIICENPNPIDNGEIEENIRIYSELGNDFGRIRK